MNPAHVPGYPLWLLVAVGLAGLVPVILLVAWVLALYRRIRAMRAAHAPSDVELYAALQALEEKNAALEHQRDAARMTLGLALAPRREVGRVN